MNTLALKTAAECDKHGERSYACINCGQSVTRKACETWHQDQCDDCIVRWAYGTAVAHADNAMRYAVADDPVTKRVLDFHAQNVAMWRKSMDERGLK